MNKSKFKIITVDDSIISRKVVLSEFSGFPYIKTISFEDPVKALTDLEDIEPDLIISDYMMPVLNGLQFCQYVRSYPQFKEIPFVLLTSSDPESIKNRALEVEVSEILKKPFKRHELFKYVSKYVDQVKNKFQGSVLVVDDSFVVLKTLKKKFESIDLKVYEAENTQRAEEILSQYPVDLIFLDNILPGKSGIKWCEELQKNPDYKEIPVIGISADYDGAQKFLKAGARDYIVKKIIKDEVIVRTEAHLKYLSLSRRLKASIEKERTLNQQKNRLLGMARS